MSLITQVKRGGPATESVATENDDLFLLCSGTVGFGVEGECGCLGGGECAGGGDGECRGERQSQEEVELHCCCCL